MDKETYDIFTDMISTGVVSFINMPNKTIYNVSSLYYADDLSLISIYNNKIQNCLTVTYIIMVGGDFIASANDTLFTPNSNETQSITDIKKLFKMCQAKLRIQMRNSVQTGFISQLKSSKEYH